MGGSSWPSAGNSERNQHSAEWVTGVVTAIEQKNGELFSDLIREQERMIPDAEVRHMPEVRTCTGARAPGLAWAVGLSRAT